jgi:SMODS-associating 4TM effector domain
MTNGRKFSDRNFLIMNKDHISIKQNEKYSLEQLAAMRLLYGKAKLVRGIRVGLTVIIPIISVLCIYYYPVSRNWLAVLSAIWLVLNRVFFTELEKGFIKDAAKIQEGFDTSLFVIGWNDILIGKKIKVEKIKELSESFKGEVDKLRNWYPGLNGSSHYMNVLLAQRTNIEWDINLRKFYTSILVFISVCLIILLFVLGIALDFSTQIFILSFIIPSLPLLLHLFETSYAHKQRFTSLEQASAKVENELENFSIDDVQHTLRQLQDFIFLKRCDINTVPEKVYWLKRNTYDKYAKEVNESYGKDINS